MGGIAGPELVAAVTNAGGFGVFGSALDGMKHVGDRAEHGN